MIERVYMQARKAESLKEVIVATDDSSIEEKVRSFNGTVCLTSLSVGVMLWPAVGTTADYTYGSWNGPKNVVLTEGVGPYLKAVEKSGDDLHAEPRAPYPHVRSVLALPWALAAIERLTGADIRRVARA